MHWPFTTLGCKCLTMLEMEHEEKTESRCKNESISFEIYCNICHLEGHIIYPFTAGLTIGWKIKIKLAAQNSSHKGVFTSMENFTLCQQRTSSSAQCGEEASPFYNQTLTSSVSRQSSVGLCARPCTFCTVYFYSCCHYIQIKKTSEILSAWIDNRVGKRPS